MKTGDKMKTRTIVLQLIPLFCISVLLGSDLIHGQSTGSSMASTDFTTMMPSLSATSTPTMSEGGNITDSPTTATMTTVGLDTGGENSTTATTEGANTNFTTPAPSSTQPQSTTSMNEGNVSTTMSSTDMGNLTSPSDMGNTTSVEDMGNATTTPSMGNSPSPSDINTTTSTPDTVKATSTLDITTSTSANSSGNTTSAPDAGNSTSTSDMGNTTSPSSTDSMTTDEYVTVTMTSEYTAVVTDGPMEENVTYDTSTEINSTMGAITWNYNTTMITTMEPETTITGNNNTRKRTGTSIPVALYMCISIILALCVVLLMGVIAHACASLRNRPRSYDISSRVNGHQNPAFDSGEVADDDEDNPVKGIMREPRVDIESGMYSDNERTPL